MKITLSFLGIWALATGFMYLYMHQESVQVDDHFVRYYTWYGGSIDNFHSGMTSEEIVRQSGVFSVSKFERTTTAENGYDWHPVYRSPELEKLRADRKTPYKKPTAEYVMSVLERQGFEPWQKKVKALN